MKRIFTLLAILMFGLTTLTQAAPSFRQSPPASQHLKKDGTPDKRFKENKTPKGPLTKSGKPDMRYKSNNPGAGKKKTGGASSGGGKH